MRVFRRYREGGFNMSVRKIITISRQYGSGGREIGKKLAEKLGIPFYDNELIEKAAQESGLIQAFFEDTERHAGNSLLYALYRGTQTDRFGSSVLSMEDNIYLAQAKVIRKVAEEGPCVIVGRCSDYILEDMANLLTVFIHADLDFRKERAIRIDGVDPAKAESVVLTKDKRRQNYYNFHATKKWGVASNYNICIDSGYCGIDCAVDVIYDYITRYGGKA